MIQSIHIKKLAILGILMAISIQSSYSQINYGFKSGVNRSIIQSDLEVADYNYRTGFYGGAIVLKAITRKCFTQAEFLYSVKGSDFLATPGITAGGKSSYHYLNLPILLGYRPTKKLAIVIGPEIGYLINAKSKHDGQEVDLTKQKSRFDLAADLGFSYQFLPSVAIETRYSYGFKLIDRNYESYDTAISPGDKKYDGANRVLQFGISYYFTKPE